MSTSPASTNTYSSPFSMASHFPDHPPCSGDPPAVEGIPPLAIDGSPETTVTEAAVVIPFIALLGTRTWSCGPGAWNWSAERQAKVGEAGKRHHGLPGVEILSLYRIAGLDQRQFRTDR